jgi:hypothetical protein
MPVRYPRSHLQGSLASRTALDPLRRLNRAPAYQDDLYRNLRVRSKRNRHSQCGPAPWFTMELKPPIQLEHAFSYIDQPQATQFSYLLTGATNAIIGHGKRNATV